MINWGGVVSSGIGVVGNGFGVLGGAGLIAGGSTVAAVPTGVNQVLGFATIATGAAIIGKSAAGAALNGVNLVNAWNDKPASLPLSLLRLIAEGRYPGSLDAVAAADVADLGLDVLSLRVPAGGYYNQVGDYVRQNTGQMVDWAAANARFAGFPAVTAALPGTSGTNLSNILSTVGGAFSSARDWINGSACTTCGGAAGGFVLYPNKPSANMAASVYWKP